MVEELVREFVPEALAEDLEFQALQRVNPKFHIGRRSARRRESDVIWRLPSRKGAEVYLYLLIEFQSDSDWWMAVRTQVYQGLLWQQVIDEKKLKAGARLPPILLLVLYNGAQRWDAATDLRKLIALSPDSALWPWQPQVQYYLLDMGTFSKDGLARRSTLIALLFRLERQCLVDEELRGLLNEVVGWFRQHEDYGRLRELFAELICQGFEARGEKVPEVFSEMMNMKSGFARNVEAWEQRSIAKGRLEGRAEGKAEGKAEALLCLLAAKFGAVTPSLRSRIRAAKLERVERWFERAIVATDLRSVFAPRRS
jgi:predicted transposase YdaD